MIIAIDGPAASGKSVSAKLLAKELNFLYLDTGAMYRCIAFSIMEEQIDISNKNSLRKFLNYFEIDLKYDDGSLTFFANGRNVTNKIRNSNVSQKVSEISAIPVIREYMVGIQRNFTKDNSCVMEGRDIGTVVFPDAEIKFFIVASDEVRAKRRQIDLESLGEKRSLNDVMDEIKKRDKHDSERGHSPLRKAFNAIEVDTTNMSINEQVSFMINKVKLTTNRKK
ncbi:MAG: (d)CMP kinase [Candidatus Neomarinimicrobiota bacterium]